MGDAVIRSRDGSVLVGVVLLALASFAVAHGLLVLALGEVAASHAAVRDLEARVAAASAMRRVLDDGGAAWLDSVPRFGWRTLATGSDGRAVVSATAWRVADEGWWIEAVARVGASEHRAARVAWALDPLARVLDLQGAVTTRVDATLDVRGTIDTSAPASAAAPLGVSDCAAWEPALDARYVTDPLAAVGLDMADSLPSLGALDFEALLGEVSVTVTGAGALQPAESLGTCAASAPWNWGDPERAWGPCGAHLPLRGARGDVTVEGGVGQVVLVVDGAVTLRSGARVYGLVLSSGVLRVETGAELVGMAIAARGVSVAPGASVRGSACWAARALAAQRATLGRLRPVHGSLGPV